MYYKLGLKYYYYYFHVCSNKYYYLFKKNLMKIFKKIVVYIIIHCENLNIVERWWHSLLFFVAFFGE